MGIYWNKTSLAAYYSVQACEFASSQECLEIYAGLYAEGLGKHLTCGLEVKSATICIHMPMPHVYIMVSYVFMYIVFIFFTVIYQHLCHSRGELSIFEKLIR